MIEITALPPDSPRYKRTLSPRFDAWFYTADPKLKYGKLAAFHFHSAPIEYDVQIRIDTGDVVETVNSTILPIDPVWDQHRLPILNVHGIKYALGWYD